MCAHDKWTVLPTCISAMRPCEFKVSRLVSRIYVGILQHMLLMLNCNKAYTPWCRRTTSRRRPRTMPTSRALMTRCPTFPMSTWCGPGFSELHMLAQLRACLLLQQDTMCRCTGDCGGR